MLQLSVKRSRYRSWFFEARTSTCPFLMCCWSTARRAWQLNKFQQPMTNFGACVTPPWPGKRRELDGAGSLSSPPQFGFKRCGSGIGSSLSCPGAVCSQLGLQWSPSSGETLRVNVGSTWLGGCCFLVTYVTLILIDHINNASTWCIWRRNCFPGGVRGGVQTWWW